MSKDKEFEIQLQFLDEAQEYLSTLETAVLGITSHGIDIAKVNAALRAAHSIKGGAGMMGFEAVSQLAHRLEDAFKVLKVEKRSLTPDAILEGLMLAGIEGLRQVIGRIRRGCLEDDPQLDFGWFASEISPIFEQLHDRLGDPPEEDAESVLSPEDAQAVVPLFFETEVETCLQRLEEAMLVNVAGLTDELMTLAQELAALGEMLQVEPFVQLCESIQQQIEQHPQQIEAVAQAALLAWRRSQSLVLSGNLDSLPHQLDWSYSEALTELFSAVTPVAFPHPANETTTVDWLPTQTPTEPVTPAVATSSTKSSRSQSRRTGQRRPAAVDSPVAAESSENSVRVALKYINQLNDLMGELTIERNGLDLHLKRLHDLVKLLSRRVQSLEQVNEALRLAGDRSLTQSPRAQLALPASHPLPLLAAAKNNPSHGVNGRSVARWRNLSQSRTNQALPRQNPVIQSNVTNGNLSLQSEFDALEFDRYGNLHLISQEVMETIVQLQEVTNDLELELEDTDQSNRNLNKTARQLQQGFNQIRMRPLSEVVSHFPRAVREWSLQYGKPVELVISGGNTLIDRSILESLSDPLMHLLRNAFDHGMEDAETRIAAGKSEQGTIEICATHRSNRTIITVSDDGRGIALEKVRQRAQQIGLDEGLLASASDEELLSLIFEPGFSTRDRVTDLSGRGVGMDVVRSQMRQVRGEVQVETEAGVGTTFILSVPYNLSMARVLMAESEGLPIAIPSESIEEIITLSDRPLFPKSGGEAFEWQGHTVQLLRLRQWLRFHCPHSRSERSTPPNINQPTVLIVSYGTQCFGLEIDRAWGTQEVAIRPVEGNLGLPVGFSGCTILGDGRVVPLVNVSDLLHWIISRMGGNPHHPSTLTAELITDSTFPTALSFPFSSPRPLVSPTVPAALPPALPATVLVIDDSVNVRRFLALTLERAGYRVEQAKDGQDALDKLTTGLTVQAIICDIEMPRLDGYGFLAQVRTNPALQGIPVTMLTSRNSAKHRQLALNLGAIAYFTKPYNEQELLQNLAQVIAAAWS